jgi:dipeptidyl aminopeptidase B
MSNVKKRFFELISDLKSGRNISKLRETNKNISLAQVLNGDWNAQYHEIRWVDGVDGEDGLYLKQDELGKDYLIVEKIRDEDGNGLVTQNLMKRKYFEFGGQNLAAERVFPSKDLKKVLIVTDLLSNGPHSFHGRYWILDVVTQAIQPLDPANSDEWVQLAVWSFQSDAIVFARQNNLFLRNLSSKAVIQISTDGVANCFYGIPGYVYEVEVFSSNSALWWASDGKHIACLRTDESRVPQYPVHYFMSRPSGTTSIKGEESYPEVREIRYPRAGTAIPTVDLVFYNVVKDELFRVTEAGEVASDEWLITQVAWAGSTGKVLVRETSRESDLLQVVLVDVERRTSKVVRRETIENFDGGWFEVSGNITFIPSDAANGRPKDGYIDMVIHENREHLALFTPLDSSKPSIITSGDWEVVGGLSGVDLKNNLLYFVATKESPIQRQVYSIKLDGTHLRPLTDTNKDGYYGISFSRRSSYALLNYHGPNVPWQKIISTPCNTSHYEQYLEKNLPLVEMTRKYELPSNIFSTIKIDGFDLHVVERRPPRFSTKKKYPVLFYVYGGPGSQIVSKEFGIDFQAYLAANLNCIVVTVDGRGTGFIGRKARTIIRGKLGYYESRDQIETAKAWARKIYVDSTRMAIWGWSYGGFLTLKTLEQDAGKTFSYGMAVAPVTDWRLYDSIYTERYMRSPYKNPNGYENSSINDVMALNENVRFLFMHGTADDNVHIQNSLTLLDKLHVARVENYDFHVFPDSNHNIVFHNATEIVYRSEFYWRNIRSTVHLTVRRIKELAN